MLVKIGEAAKFYGVSVGTIRKWEEEGKIKCVYTPHGTRLFEKDDFGKSEVEDEEDKGKIFYCRVSSSKQKDDLDRQLVLARKLYPEHEIVYDISSGLNWKRRGLRKILAKAAKRDISEVIVFHRDRLCRFGFEILDYVFSLNNVSLVVHEETNVILSKREEFIDDVLSIIHIYSCRELGRRRYEGRREGRRDGRDEQELKDKKDKVISNKRSRRKTSKIHGR